MKNMKKIKKIIEEWEDGLEERWNNLSIEQQRKAILIALGLYSLITVTVLILTWSSNQEGMKIRHIEKPVLPVSKVPALKFESLYIQKQL